MTAPTVPAGPTETPSARSETPPGRRPDPEGSPDQLEPGGPEGAAPAAAANPLEGAVRAIEEASELDTAVVGVAPFADRLSSGALGDVLGGAWLGHAMHPMLTDVPIGCWTSASLLDLLGGRRSRPAAQLLTGLGVLAVVPTVLTGWSDFGRLDDPRDRRVAVVHAGSNGLAALLQVRSWWARRRGRHVRGAALGLLANSVATGAGYLGGHLASGRGVDTGERFGSV